MATQEFQTAYFYFDYSLIFTCECGAKVKTYGTNHTNKFKCKRGREYVIAPKVVTIG